MRILFLTDFFPPEVNAPATRTIEHCREWVKMGAEVTIVTGAPNFPQGKVYEGYKNKLYQTEMIDGIKVVRVWTYVAQNKGFFKRVLDQFSLAITGFWGGLFKKADIIVVTSPTFFITIAAFWLSIFKWKPWVFEVRDLWPESIKSVGAMNDGFAYRMLERIEWFLYRRATRVIPVTDAFKLNLINRGIQEDKIKVVTNGANLELFPVVPKDQELLDKLNLNGKFVFGYIGTHGMAHGLGFIMNAIKKVKDDRIHFLFVGAGAEKENVVKLAKELELNNVTFHDPIPKAEIPKFLSVIDAALVPLRRLDTFKTVIPSKIFESSSMGKPTLLGVEGQAQEIVEKYNGGICFEPENEEDFLLKVKQLTTNPELYKEFQIGSLELAKAFDRKKLAKKMFTYLEEACK